MYQLTKRFTYVEKLDLPEGPERHARWRGAASVTGGRGCSLL